MFKTRLNIKATNFDSDREPSFRYAHTELCDDLEYPLSNGLQFELVPGIVTSKVTDVTWDFEAREFRGFCGVWISGGNAEFDGALESLRKDGYEITECFESEYACGHTRWIPTDPEQCQVCAEADRKREERIQKRRRIQTDPSMPTITIRIPKDVHLGLKEEAAQRGVTFNQICIEALEAELRRVRESRPTKQG